MDWSTPGAIISFRDEYAFLSNHFNATFMWRNVEFSSGEQAFVYAKTFFTVDSAEEAPIQAKILSTAKPGDLKALGRAVKIDIDLWNKRKVQYMREIVHAKFLNNTSDFPMVTNLGMTGATMLIEGNTWGDKFWGRVHEDGKWQGHNVLGVILMEERGWWSRGSRGNDYHTKP